MKNPFEDRTISFGVSIGTGLSLETVFDPPDDVRYDKDREIPMVIKPDDYKYHIYNIYTIARNILSACVIKDKFQLINNKFFLPTVLEEIENINMLYEDFKAKPILFMPDYTSLFKKFNKDKENATTNAVIDYDTMRKIFKNIKPSMDFITTTSLVATNEKVLLLSNYTIDLLNYKRVPKLDLLESHTGKIKTKAYFNSKYHPIGKRDMSIIPFTEKLLYLLGDKTIVKPGKLKLRIDLYKIAEEKNWNNKTTLDKIMYGIKDNPDLMAAIQKFN